jgi:uncharacterized membrane protein
VYSLYAHELTLSDDRSSFGYVFALASLYLVAVCFAVGSRYRFALILLASLLVLLGWAVRDTLAWDPRWVYLGQHAGAMLGLALLFGLTLNSVRGSLVTRMARLVHAQELPASVERYTWQVTLAWTLFFVVMGVVSLALFFLGYIEAWSWFINFLTLPLVIAMFVLEYLVRRIRIRDFEHKSILDGIRAYSRLK